VAKLDRLSRNVHFISGQMSHQVEFIVCDLGRQSDPFVLHAGDEGVEAATDHFTERIILDAVPVDGDQMDIVVPDVPDIDVDVQRRA
jgi:hypothetical protein